MTGERERVYRFRRMKAQRLAALIQQAEVVSPGCFGEAWSIIRQLAAGDDVAPDDLTAVLAPLKTTFGTLRRFEGILPPKPKRP